VRSWPLAHASEALTPRDDVVAERDLGDGRFVQESGPFVEYERSVHTEGNHVVDVTKYRLDIPWFGWLFQRAIRSRLQRHQVTTGPQPAWAPPDRLTADVVRSLGLLAAASLTAAFVNTLFTQTVNFAATDFGISEQGQAIAGVIVRCGIILALPFTILADRLGRRRMIVLLAWLAPLLAATGALAPNFWVLTATQAIARPLGIALDLLIGIAIAEQMPRNSRAYAVSVLAMASGLGAGVAVGSLPLADVGPNGWRFVYALALVWLVVAVDVSRRLTETPRFEHLVEVHHVGKAHINRRRFAIISSVAFFGNLFIAPASYFQNRYLDDVRGFNGATIAIFTLATATPASIGFVIGGKLADLRGRRLILATMVPSATSALVVSFWVGGWPMWVAAFIGGLFAGVAYPAFAVYRSELFPTGRRGRAGGFIVTLGLAGGSIGILIAGQLLDRGWSYGTTMSLLALAQVVTATVVFTTYPETAHRTLEELNPEDA
jgi:MFS family permease